jgi:hypothetical protein
MGKTTIQLEEETRDRLLKVGRKEETYDDLLNRLVDLVEDKKCAA